jgi:hypothetical protein
MRENGTAQEIVQVVVRKKIKKKGRGGPRRARPVADVAMQPMQCTLGVVSLATHARAWLGKEEGGGRDAYRRRR